jgi:hypothetical protein
MRSRLPALTSHDRQALRIMNGGHSTTSATADAAPHTEPVELLSDTAPVIERVGADGVCPHCGSVVSDRKRAAERIQEADENVLRLTLLNNRQRAQAQRFAWARRVAEGRYRRRSRLERRQDEVMAQLAEMRAEHAALRSQIIDLTRPDLDA